MVRSPSGWSEEQAAAPWWHTLSGPGLGPVRHSLTKRGVRCLYQTEKLSLALAKEGEPVAVRVAQPVCGQLARQPGSGVAACGWLCLPVPPLFPYLLPRHDACGCQGRGV